MNDTFTSAMIKTLAAVAASQAPLWTTLLGAIGLWTWTVINPSPLRITASCAYTVLTYLPLVFKRG